MTGLPPAKPNDRITGTPTRPNACIEWRFMYLLPDCFAATPGQATPSRRKRLLAIAAGQLPRMSARSSGIHPIDLIHCALPAHPRASSGTRSVGAELVSPAHYWHSSAFRFAQQVAGMFPPLRALPPSGLAPDPNERERAEPLSWNAMPEAHLRVPARRLRLEVRAEAAANRSTSLAHSERVARQAPVADDAQRAVRVLTHEHPL